MVLPVGCLALTRHVLGIDSALADNLSANGVGLVLAFGARFYLFKRFVFRRPVESAPTRSPRRSDRSTAPPQGCGVVTAASSRDTVDDHAPVVPRP